MKYALLSFIWCFSFAVAAEQYPYKIQGNPDGCNEQKLDLISPYLPPNPVIVQAGAHYGSETVSFAAHWPQATIIGFEPNPHAFDILSQSTAKHPNIHIYNLALNDKARISTFYVCHGSSGDTIYEHASSLLRPSPQMEVHYQGPELDVECVILDDWCEQNRINHIDFLRLDVQGSELQVLKSSPRILSQVKVIDVATNFYSFRVGTAMHKDLNDFLTTSGFIPISHCYQDGLEGNAIYINDQFFDDGLLDRSQYKKCYVKGLDAYFYVDEVPDGIKSFLKEGVYWEGTIGNLIKKYVKEGSIAVDVGAHIGIHTIVMSRKAGPQGQVYAFEPQKKMYAEQVFNLKINQCNNVVSIPKALGECSKTVQMTMRNPINEGGTSIGEGGDFVEMITLDSLNLQNVSLIKIDVEHYEYFVLKGAKETLLRNKPVIIFEIMGNFDYKSSPDQVKEQFDRVIALVESYGYKVFQIFGNDHIAFPLERLTF